MKQMIRYFKENKLTSWILLILLAVLIALPQLPKKVMGNYTIHIFVIVMLYAFWGCAWNLLGSASPALS